MNLLTLRDFLYLITKPFFKRETFLKKMTYRSLKNLVTDLIQFMVYLIIILSIIFFIVSQFITEIESNSVFIALITGVSIGFITSIIITPFVNLRNIYLLSINASLIFGFVWPIIFGLSEEGFWNIKSGIIIGAGSGLILSNIIGLVTEDIKESIILGIGTGIYLAIALLIIGLLFSSDFVLVQEIYKTCIFFGLSFLTAFFFIWSRWFYLPIVATISIDKPALNSLPYHWDENLSVPLPLLNRTLLKVAQNNFEITVNELIYISKNKPFLLSSIQKTIMTLINLESKKNTNINDIIHFKRKFDFISNNRNILKQDNILFFKLVSFSSDVEKADVEINLDNRLKLFGILQENLNKLITDFTNTDTPWKNIFVTLSSCWNVILENEIERLGSSLRNCYIVGTPITDDSDLFVGRKDIIEQIGRIALSDGGACAILFRGRRRSGKTSTLLNLKRYIISNLKPIYIDCSIIYSVGHFTKTISTLVNKTFFEETISSIRSNSLSELTEDLVAIQNQLEKSNLYIIFSFDEYERLSEKITKASLSDLANTFRNWIQHLPRIVCLFAGSHQFSEIPGIDWTDYLINVRVVNISFLDAESALKLVTKPVKSFEIQYIPDIKIAVDLVDRLGRQPFLIQATMSELVNYLNSRGRKSVGKADIDLAINKMLQSWEPYFQHIWTIELNENERHFLSELSINKKLNENNHLTRTLMQKEILTMQNKSIYFSVPVFKQWIELTQF